MVPIKVEDPERNLPPGDSPINVAPALQYKSNGSVHSLITLPSTVPRRTFKAGELMPVSVAPHMCDREAFTPTTRMRRNLVLTKIIVLVSKPQPHLFRVLSAPT